MKQITKIFNYKTPIFLLLFAGVVVNGCSNIEANSNKAEGKGIPVTVQKIEIETISLPVHISGSISSSKESRLSFKTGGIIKSIYVNEGDKVKNGQVLAKLDLKEIQEQVNQAVVGLEKAQRDYERVSNLFNDTVATLEQMQNAKSALDVAKANMNIAEYNLKYSTIIAPSDGIILKKFFEEDEIAGTGYPIFYFASSEENWRLLVGISDKDIVKFSLGDKAQIITDAYPNKELNAIVSRIANAPGEYTGLYEIELSIMQVDVELKHGLFAKGAIFPSQYIDCYSLSIDAVQEGIGNSIMFYSVSDDGTTALKKEAQVLAINQLKVYINKDDLKDDLMVIIESQKEIKNLDKINIIENHVFAALK